MPSALSISSRISSRFRAICQTLRVTVRYRRLARDSDDVLEEQLCDAPERWYFPHELSLLLESAGFVAEGATGNYSLDEPFAPSHFVMALCGTEGRRGGRMTRAMGRMRRVARLPVNAYFSPLPIRSGTDIADPW